VRTLSLALVAVVVSSAACVPRRVPPSDSPVQAQAPERVFDISYRLGLTDPASHLYDVEIDIAGIDGIDTLRLQMPVWSPGRYARMDFAKNVQEFAATDGGGRPLRWEKEHGSLWRVASRDAGRVRIRYRVYANDLSGTFSVLDTLHANWNGPSLFMYVVGHKPDPVRLTVAAPDGWMLMNGTADDPAQREFRFPTYDHFVDTPTEVAPGLTVDSFTVDDRLYRVMVHHAGSRRGQTKRFVGDVEKIVRYQNRVIAPPPLARYTFLFNIGFAGGDGMEHLSSTQIMNPAAWTDTAALLPGVTTASHEYFHTWWVKRIRPAALGPFDYTREQYQPSLWVAEGWTNYYGGMTLHRGGIVPKEVLYSRLAGMIRYNSETPGRTERSARASSLDAPFFDGARHEMEVNAARTWISYYAKGEALAMLLDLMIRARSDNARSLDDVLRLVKTRTWDAPPESYYLQGRGYTEEDIERAVSDVYGADLHDWFERYVAGTEELPWRETLGLAGLELRIGDGAERTYELRESRSASEAQLRVREGWLSGTVK
jgi:predicted metalloprotease with PDZ domain